MQNTIHSFIDSITLADVEILTLNYTCFRVSHFCFGSLLFKSIVSSFNSKNSLPTSIKLLYSYIVTTFKSFKSFQSLLTNLKFFSDFFCYSLLFLTNWQLINIIWLSFENDNLLPSISFQRENIIVMEKPSINSMLGNIWRFEKSKVEKKNFENLIDEKCRKKTLIDIHSLKLKLSLRLFCLFLIS